MFTLPASLTFLKNPTAPSWQTVILPSLHFTLTVGPASLSELSQVTAEETEALRVSWLDLVTQLGSGGAWI